MSYIYKVTLIVETDEDPGTILDLAIEAGSQLAEDTEGTTDENDVCVQSMMQHEYDALQAPSTSRTVSLEDVKKLDDGLEELAEKLARIMNRSARN
jgi:hypothetical protein|tara:strand:+ start:323 stop:610 length:288 start_codon:yes stop_codon:yes gene_type:complete